MSRKSPCADHHGTIVRLLGTGLTLQQIADRLGLSKPMVSAYCLRRRLKGPHGRGKRPTIDRAAVRAMIAEGLTQHAIAARLRCGRSAVERICRALRLQTARTGPRSGSGHPAWKNGRTLDKHGYVQVYAPLHPRANSSGRVFEHRLVMEVVTGRYLTPAEVVDHRDDHPRHNAPDNLRLFATNADHLRATLTGREKATPRQLIPGAYGCNQTIARCPDAHETLAGCPPETRAALDAHIARHRPTPGQHHLSLSALRRLAAARSASQGTSTA